MLHVVLPLLLLRYFIAQYVVCYLQPNTLYKFEVDNGPTQACCYGNEKFGAMLVTYVITTPRLRSVRCTADYKIQ